MSSIPGPGLFRNETVKSIVVWGILAQLLSPLLQPLVQEIQTLVFPRFPDTPLSPAEAAAAVVKGHANEERGAAEAAISGLDLERFRLLVQAIQNPPGVETLLELWRRRVIPEAGTGAESVSVEQGIREGQTGNKWIEPLKALRTQLPSPQAALAALLEGQINESTARELYAEWGGDPRYFELQFNTQGSAPTPLEAAEMARRGIIPWEGEGPGVVSFRQAFLEGPWRNKWLGPYRSLSEYIPPPRTVTAMVREGSLSDADALGLFGAAGLNPKLAAAYLASAHKTKVSADHQLAKSDVLTLYYDQLWSREEALAALRGLDYSAENAAFLLDYTDFRRDKALLDRAVGRIHSLYVGHRIDKSAALAGLDGLGLATASRDHLLLTWDQERALNVRLLTPAEWATLARDRVIGPAEAAAELVGLGYSERDAALYLQAHHSLG